MRKFAKREIRYSSTGSSRTEVVTCSICGKVNCSHLVIPKWWKGRTVPKNIRDYDFIETGRIL